MRLKRKDLLGIRDLNREDIEIIFEVASSFKEVLKRPIPKVPSLRGKTVCNLFFEPSTRTRSSFELAEKRLSADTLNFSASTSSMTKGETALDTLKNIAAMRVDAFVIRHSFSGAAHFLAKHTPASVINAGDGINEHPTQALLDIYTIKERKGKTEGLKALIVGDILHSRVARSNIFGMLKMGIEVILCGPPTLLPREFESIGCKICYKLDEVLKEADVIMALRVQKERGGKSLIPSFREYRKLYGITSERLKNIKEDVLIMHPGPVNWGVEMDYDALDLKNNLILEQVENGVAIRMAVLYLLIGPGKEEEI